MGWSLDNCVLENEQILRNVEISWLTLTSGAHNRPGRDGATATDETKLWMTKFRVPTRFDPVRILMQFSFNCNIHVV